MVTRVFDILGQYRSKYPMSVALAGKEHGQWKYYSGEDYVSRAEQFACGLLSLGFEKGDKIATVSNNRPEWNIADMGMLQAGVVHLPVYPNIGTEDYRYIFSHAAPKAILLSDKSLYEKLKPILEASPSIRFVFSFNEIEGVAHWSELLRSGEEKSEYLRSLLVQRRESILPGDLCTLIYTSGTTGVPKGVMLSHENLVSNLIATSKVYSYGYGCKTMSFLPLSHIYERMINLHFQYKGIAVYYAENMGTLMENVKEIRPDIMTAVPRVLEKIYAGILRKGKTLKGISALVFQWAVRHAQDYDPDHRGTVYRLKLQWAHRLVYTRWMEALGGNLKIIVSGGAPLQPRLARFFSATGIQMVEGYGLTETAPVIAVGIPVKNMIRFGTVGPVLEGVEVKIAEDGEILCKGPNVMMGYYRDPEQTARVMNAQGWFHTGDIGCFEEGVYLKITDRKKEIFKLSNGKYIAPLSLELKLNELPFVDQSMVIGEDEKFPSALLSVDFSWLEPWARELGIPTEDRNLLIRSEKVEHMVRREISRINQEVGTHERLKRVRLVAEEWTPSNGMLSSSLKLKRAVLRETYRDLMDEIYSVGEEA